MIKNIRVTGKGKISVKPDTIRLSISSKGVYSDYEEIIKKSAEDTNVIRKTIEDLEFNGSDLKTERFDIDSNYESYYDKNNNYKKRFMGYKYKHDMFIKFPNDNELLGKILYSLSKCPVKVEFSIAYTVKDTEAAKNELLVKAVQDSKTKAEELSKAAGVRLGEIINIDYSWGELNIYTQPMYMKDIAESGLLYDEEEATYKINLEVDDIDVTDTVTIVWEIK